MATSPQCPTPGCNPNDNAMHPTPKTQPKHPVPCRVSGTDTRSLGKCEMLCNGSGMTGWEQGYCCGHIKSGESISSVPKGVNGAIESHPCPLPPSVGCPIEYLGKGWCPRSRMGWWSACCSHWSTAVSPGCSSGAPGSAPVSAPWPGRWRQGTPPHHAVGMRVVSTLRDPLDPTTHPHDCYLGCNSGW